MTNPPFSLFREYVSQLFKYDKKFVIIGPKNAITYKEIFPLIKNNRMWTGYTPMGRDILFTFPEKYRKDFIDNFNESSKYKIVEGKMLARASAIWYTNIPLQKFENPIFLVCEYNPEEYPKYDNYDAIEVSKTLRIPCDYYGVMGVPITFLDKYCPAQFEILVLAAGNSRACGLNYNVEYK